MTNSNGERLNNAFKAEMIYLIFPIGTFNSEAIALASPSKPIPNVFIQ